MKDLTEIFAILRKPIRINADNDPSFSSRALSDYYEANEIRIPHSIQCLPRLNSEVSGSTMSVAHL